MIQKRKLKAAPPIKLFDVGTVPVWKQGTAVVFTAGMQIDVDGAPNAYHPPTAAHPKSGHPPGLDDLRNAGAPGNWYGIVTNRAGNPIIQGPDDPYPGYYVSPTALFDPLRAPTSTKRYVDSTKFPYLVLPGKPSFKDAGCLLGDLAMVFYKDRKSFAIWADVGPAGKIGEGSIALATALGIYQGVNVGHDAKDITYVLFPGTRGIPAWPHELDEMHNRAEAEFLSWGGRAKLKTVS